MSLAVFAVAFLASGVEMVEAATIVLAMAVSRNKRSALLGLGAALLVLMVLVAAFGPLLTRLPIDGVRVVVGTLALLFGLDWLRKGILRQAGLKAKRNEAALFTRAQNDVQADALVIGFDRLGFVVAFKAVLLEGLEVVVIVLSVGSAQHNMLSASAGAGAALAIVAIAAIAIRGPLSSVPENTMKLIVGVMLVSFGTFWAAEGLGVQWPNGDADIAALVVWYCALATISIEIAHRRVEVRP